MKLIKMLKEEGGFRKWSIGINLETASIEIDFERHPNSGHINLSDLCRDDLERITKMFEMALTKTETEKEK